MKQALAIAAVLLVALGARGQVFTGRVATAGDLPVNRASVYLKHGGGIVSFCFTGKDGLFSIDSKGKPCDTLEVRRMGYAMRRIPLSGYRDGQTITLEEQVNELREVVVKSQKIRQEGDTLDYLVSSFRGKQDRTIADVIRKMPGLTVNDDGTIEYQGKKINKFYIEGMDLLGGKYGQASENLDAGKVKKVQVLERHQPVRALKDKDFSEQAALNIVLADSARNVWSHAVDVSVGASPSANPDWLYDNRLASMLFSRKMQSISIYKNNNTGKNIGREVSPMAAYLDDSAPTDDGMLGNISLPAPELNAGRSLFNSTHLFATNWLFKTRGNNDVRIQVDGITDRSLQRQSSSVIYTAAGGAMIAQEVEAESHHDALNAEVMYKQNTDRQYLTNDLNGYVDFDRSEGMSQLNGVATRQSVRPRKSYVSDKLSFIRNIGGGHTVSANAYLSLNCLPGSLLLVDGTMQNLDRRSIIAGGNASFGRKAGVFYLGCNVGTDAKVQRMDISLQDVDTHRTYTEWRSFARPTLAYKSGHIDFRLGAPLYWTSRDYADQRKDDFTFEPSLFLRAMPNSSLAFTALYNYSWIPESLHRLLDVPVFTDYVTMLKGYGKPDDTMAHSATASVEYKDVVKGLFISAGYDFTDMRHQRMYACNVDGNIYESYATDLTTNSISHGVSGRISESWNVASLTTTLSGGCHWNSYDMLVSGDVRSYVMRSVHVRADFSLQPCDWMSVEGRSDYSYSKQTCKSGLPGSSPLQSFTHQLKCCFMPGRFQIEWNNEIYHGSDESVSFTYFSDLSISYRTKRYEFGLACNNILGKDEYCRQLLTDTRRAYTITRLRPRECMVKFAMNL